MFKSDVGQILLAALIVVVITVGVGVWGYFRIQAARQLEAELAEVGVTTRATVIRCPSAMSTCAAELQYKAPFRNTADNTLITKTYTTQYNMSCVKCRDKRNKQITIVYHPNDPTQLRILPFGFDSNNMLVLVIMLIAVFWLGLFLSFINFIRERIKKRRDVAKTGED